jgi:arylformamidase
MHVTFSIRTLLAVTIALGAVGGVLPARAHAQQAQQQSDGKPARPPQDAVLADNSVVEANVPYGEDELQRLDVYAPRGASHAPVVVFVHGGEWTRGDKAAVSFKPRFFNQNGILFVSINYRLTPAATHPAHVSDVAAAIRWVHDHSARFGGDPNKIVLMGHSAGCHLVTLVALDPRYLAKAGLRPADLRGVVAWSGGSYDLVQKVEQGSAYADYIQKAFGESQQVWRDASPVNHADNAKTGPAFLFASIESGSASHQAAERLAKLIHDVGGRSTTSLLEGRDHFGANHLLGAPDDTTGTIFLQFVTEATK